MDKRRILTLIQNMRNFKLCYFLQFHHSSILLNNSGRAFCKLPLEENNGKNEMKLNYFPSTTFCTAGKTPPTDEVLQKDRTKMNFSTRNLRCSSTKNRADNIFKILHTEKLEFQDRFQNEKTFVHMQMKQFKNRKWIFLFTRFLFTDHKFVRIFVPEDAYSLINAMDELLSKIVDQEKPPECPIFVRVEDGLLYDYGLLIRPNKDKLEYRMVSITTAQTPLHKPKAIFMPIRLFPLLRDRMAKMLEKFDGTQQIEQIPSPLPKWILESEKDSQQNIVQPTSVEEMNKEKEQLETIRQETLDFVVNIRREKFARKISIELQRNKQGKEFIQIVQKFNNSDSSKDIEKDDNSKFVFFPPIPMPTDAYRLLNAMQTLSKDLQEKCPNHQIPNDIPLGTICRQIIKGGLLYDYKMEIRNSKITKQLEFQLETIATTESCKWHKTEKLYGTIPLNVFNWLKEQFAQLLESSSSNQQKQICLAAVDEPKPMEFKNVNRKGQTACKNETNKICEGLIRREKKHYLVEGESYYRTISINFEQGRSGKKFVKIAQMHEKNIGNGLVPHFIDFPAIPVPEDAYCLLDAMHTMSIELHRKRPALLSGENKSSMLCQKFVKGLNYGYKLEIHSCQKQQLDFRLQTWPGKAVLFTSKSLLGPIPINIFNWLMEKMTEILADYDDFNKFDKTNRIRKMAKILDDYDENDRNAKKTNQIRPYIL